MFPSTPGPPLSFWKVETTAWVLSEKGSVLLHLEPSPPSRGGREGNARTSYDDYKVAEGEPTHTPTEGDSSKGTFPSGPQGPPSVLHSLRARSVRSFYHGRRRTGVARTPSPSSRPPRSGRHESSIEQTREEPVRYVGTLSDKR